MTTITLTCTNCNSFFERPVKVHNQNVKRGQTNHFCGLCRKKKENPCKHCGKPTKNPKFCSNRCSALVNSKTNKKRPLEGRCGACGTPISAQRVWCKDCKKSNHRSKKDWSKITLGEARQRREENNDPLVWNHARREYTRQGGSKRCSICGYDRTYHVAHIKPVYSFPDEATISEVNHISNLIALCPNHHWEFDHNLLDLVDVRSIELLTSPL